MKENFSKKEKKHLRQLVSKAYEIDLSRCLNDLAAKFDSWKNSNITVWDLNQAIHEFHNKTARDLYKFYEFVDLEFVVASAVNKGFLVIDEIEECVRDRINSICQKLQALQRNNK